MGSQTQWWAGLALSNELDLEVAKACQVRSVVLPKNQNNNSNTSMDKGPKGKRSKTASLEPYILPFHVCTVDSVLYLMMEAEQQRLFFTLWWQQPHRWQLSVADLLYPPEYCTSMSTVQELWNFCNMAAADRLIKLLNFMISVQSCP